MEWHEFPEGEEPEVLTSISSFCNEGKHDQCRGHSEAEEHGGQIVFCICPCHEVRWKEWIAKQVKYGPRW